MSKGIRSIIKENIPSVLEEILRKHKVYTIYVERTYYAITKSSNKVLKTKKMNTKEYQKFVRGLVRNRSDIIYAFNWSETPEGFAFWEGIYDKMIERLEQLR